MKRSLFVGLIVAGLLAGLWRSLPSQEKAGETVAARVGKNRGSYLTVLDFGAAGDGTTDDTAAIQAVIEAQTGSIRFPAGKYRITRPLVIDLDRVGYTALVGDGAATLVMAGPGPAIRLVGTHLNGSAAPNTFKENVWERQRMPVVEGLAIQGDHAEADGIEAEGTMQLTLRGVHIRACRHGVHLVKRNRNVLIDACHIYHNRGCGIFLDHVDLHQTNISASHVSYCGGGGVVVRGGNVRNVHIAGCDIEGNMAQDGPPAANVLLDCDDGSVAEVAITGCTIQHTKEAGGSANIRILGKSTVRRQGKDIEANCGHVTIGDNVLSDVATNIHIQDARGITITGNTFWKGHAQNVLIESSQQIILGPNMMERNPLYAGGEEAPNSVIFRDCRDCTITGLHLHNTMGPAGITLERCTRMAVAGCTILDCDGAGILLQDSPGAAISNCTILEGREGKKLTAVKEIVQGKEVPRP